MTRVMTDSRAPGQVRRQYHHETDMIITMRPLLRNGFGSCRYIRYCSSKTGSKFDTDIRYDTSKFLLQRLRPADVWNRFIARIVVDEFDERFALDRYHQPIPWHINGDPTRSGELR